MMPAEIVLGAVSVPPDTFSETDHFLNELSVREGREVFVGRRHAASVPRPVPTVRKSRFEALDIGTRVAHSKAGGASVPAPWPDAPEPMCGFRSFAGSPERVTKANGESGAPRR